MIEVIVKPKAQEAFKTLRGFPPIKRTQEIETSLNNIKKELNKQKMRILSGELYSYSESGKRSDGTQLYKHDGKVGLNAELKFLINATILKELQKPNLLKYIFNFGGDDIHTGMYNHNGKEIMLQSQYQLDARDISGLLENVFTYSLSDCMSLDDKTKQGLELITKKIQSLTKKQIDIEPAKIQDINNQFGKICNEFKENSQSLIKIRKSYEDIKKEKYPPYGLEFKNSQTLDTFVDELLNNPKSKFWTELVNDRDPQRLLRALEKNEALEFSDKNYTFQEIFCKILDEIEKTQDAKHNYAKIFRAFKTIESHQHSCTEIVSKQYQNMLETEIGKMSRSKQVAILVGLCNTNIGIGNQNITQSQLKNYIQNPHATGQKEASYIENLPEWIQNLIQHVQQMFSKTKDQSWFGKVTKENSDTQIKRGGMSRC